MTHTATSLKLRPALKRKLTKLATQTHDSTHALMVRALEEYVTAAELHGTFVGDAIEADREMERSGQGYALADVHRYVLERAREKPARRPRPVKWR